MFARYQIMPTDRDRVSRLYYACYHVAIAAIELKADYHKLREGLKNTFSYHAALQEIYPKIYGKPTEDNKHKVKIVSGKAGKSLKIWHELRVVADYVIFGNQFEDHHKDRTLEHIRHMESFVAAHFQYFLNNHKNKLEEPQLAAIEGINT